MKSTLCAGIKLLSLAFVVCLTKTSIAKPQEVKLTDVGHCQYLADVKGHSGYGKNFNWKVLAKQDAIDALNKADKEVATHVVWVAFEPVGAFNGVAVARAYRCQP